MGYAMRQDATSQADDTFVPTPREIDYAAALTICGLLELTSGDRFSALALLNAMTGIEKRYRNPNRVPLSKKIRDRMLRAIARLEQKAIDNLPGHYDQAYITSGFDALAHLVVMCAEPPSSSARRSADAVKDICAYARMFQNNIHNVAISEQICARAIRAHERREVHVRELHSAAVGKAA